MPNIVSVSVSQTAAPAPSALQQTGALVSQGATNLANGVSQLLTQPSDLTAILLGAKTLASLAWSGSVVTAATTVPHGYTTADTLYLTISGASPAGYNGTYLCTITGASGFTYALASNPGANVTPGSYTNEDVAELNAMVTTFFAQGSQLGVYVLELGAGSPAEGVTALGAWITANPGVYYAYLVPRTWGSEATYPAFLAAFESLTAKTYFFTTVTQANYGNFIALMKCVVMEIEAPSIPASEFSLAAGFWQVLNTNPSGTNRAAPFSYRYLYGVTPYPAKGNNALFTTLAAANVNYIATGNEGGITTAIWVSGKAADGNNFSYWYSVDWSQINADLFVSNAVINGSNNPINPLYNNQDGINRLQAVAAAVMTNGVTYGLVLGQVVQTALTSAQLATALAAGTYANKTVVNAIPFIPYNQSNPTDYKNGIYSGLSVSYVPQLGFQHINFNINVSSFVAQ